MLYLATTAPMRTMLATASVPEYTTIGLIAIAFVILIFRNRDNQVRYLYVILFVMFLLGFYYYWLSLCRNQVNVDTETFIVYGDNNTIDTQANILNRAGYHLIEKCKYNSNLQLWGLNNNQHRDIFGSDGLADGNDGKVRGGSGEPDIDVSQNLIIKVPENNLLTTIDKGFVNPKPNDGSIQNETYIIGLTDTGIDRRFEYPNLWQNLNNQYDTWGKNGWNFINDNNGTNGYQNIYEPNNSHGTLVAYLLERELANTPHRFLPMVILDENKEGVLFDALCAFEYAIALNKDFYGNKNKIRAINASWGFYGFENAALKKGLQRLKDNNILLVCAAGNSDSKCDKCEELDKNNLRNLSLRRKKFYPAAYSTEFDNVISVTTVNMNGDVFQSANQNYSDEFVDLGVQSDNYRTGDFLFKFPKYNNTTEIGRSIASIPLFEKKYAYWGSSFATPVATANIFSKKLNESTQSAYSLLTKQELLKNEVNTINGDEISNKRYKITSTWRATNLTKRGKVLLKNY